MSNMSAKSSEDILAEIGLAYQESNLRMSTEWENYSNAEIINSSNSPSFRERQPKQKSMFSHSKNLLYKKRLPIPIVKLLVI